MTDKIYGDSYYDLFRLKIMGFNENNNRLSIQKAGSPKLPAFNHMNATYNYP
jgi:hypothetical protein